MIWPSENSDDSASDVLPRPSSSFQTTTTVTRFASCVPSLTPSLLPSVAAASPVPSWGESTQVTYRYTS